jgi:hypothetical protein
MQKFTSFLILSLLLSACGASESTAVNAGKAMGETACLLFDESVSFEEISEKTTTIMSSYGWKDPEEIDQYLASIQGNPEELEAVKTAAADELTKGCGESLSTSGMTALDLAESMISQ